MNTIINRVLNNNLEDLKGTIIEGKVPISEDLLNDIIQEFFQKKSGNENNTKSDLDSNTTGNIMERLLSGLDVKDLRIELHEKVAVLKINLRKFP